jgi:hypothetical protein
MLEVNISQVVDGHAQYLAPRPMDPTRRWEPLDGMHSICMGGGCGDGGAIPVGGVAAFYVAGALLAIGGLITSFNWKGCGERLYRYIIVIPGGGWYKTRGGLKTFRVVMGGGASLFGLLCLVVASIAWAR